MKTLRMLGAAAVLVLVSSLAPAQEKIDPALFVGKWEPTKKAGTVIEMVKGGKLTITAAAADGKSTTFEGTWAFDGKLKVKFKTPAGDERDVSLTVKSLTADKLVTVDDKEKEEELKKVK